MSPRLEEFDWSFVGAVVIISLACFAFIITVTYYCWLYEIATSLKQLMTSLNHLLTSLLGQNGGTGGSTELPVRDHTHNTATRSHCQDVHCDVTLQPRPTQKDSVLLKKSPRGRGQRRPRQTRQRAVNVALHELKYHNQRVPPAKPVKSEAVKAYVKSTSSEVNSFTSTTITDNISSDSDDVVIAGVTGAGRGDVVEVTESLRLTDKKPARSAHVRAPLTDKKPALAPTRSYRSKKWSKIKTKQRAKEASLAKVTELVHKLGRSTRAVAPQTLTNSRQFRMIPYVRKAISRNDTGLKKNTIKPESIFEALLALRKSGDLGLNLISNPVSKSFKLKSKINEISDNKTMIIKEQYEDSSGSDEVKSSSVSSSIIIISKKQPPREPPPLNDINNNPQYSGDTEGEKRSKKNLNVMDESNNMKTCDNESAVPPNIDPSKQVFGGETTTREGPVRRIDGLFCSTTPSSIDSCVSDQQVFDAQIEHNNMSSEGNHSYQLLRSSRDDLNVIDDKRETITSNTITQSKSRDRGVDHMGSEDVESESSSSFNSTTLPTVSSETVSTIEISSEEGNIGKLKYFGDLR